MRVMDTAMKLYISILIFTAIGLAFSNNVVSNYFKDAYQVDAYQRGLIEFPREIPGIISIFVIAGLSFLSDLRISMIAQILSAIGIIVLGVTTPSFNMMLLFIFINSMGMHLFFPLQDSIGLALAEKDKMGVRMGQYKGIFTGFQMLASVFVFIGFKKGFLSFVSPVKWLFLLAGASAIVVFYLMLKLDRHMQVSHHQPKLKVVFRKQYSLYYILVVMFGVQKQIMMVYGPWVLIELLNKQADTLAILTIISSFVGIFFIPALGRWLDRYGVKKLLYADALSFIGVYLLYGLLSAGYVSDSLPKVGIGVLLAYGLFIIDRMSTQMSIVRTVYLKTIVLSASDITPTLTLGQSMDHFVSILCAYLGGIVWVSWGPQYIFFLAAGLSVVNLLVAIAVKVPVNNDADEVIQ
ncbi:MFS transporter [Fusibacter paucivorans]|uniref:MFS transporter n=2 Tax=Fusibacter paucivorans TaxID=76009 RepID=A0ABS5PP50_9FIRM|nr:MFS transporter [Fusibacter paucivorans]